MPGWCFWGCTGAASLGIECVVLLGEPPPSTTASLSSFCLRSNNLVCGENLQPAPRLFCSFPVCCGNLKRSLWQLKQLESVLWPQNCW